MLDTCVASVSNTYYIHLCRRTHGQLDSYIHNPTGVSLSLRFGLQTPMAKHNLRLRLIKKAASFLLGLLRQVCTQQSTIIHCCYIVGLLYN